MAFKDYRDIIRQMEREMQQLSDEAFRGFFGVPVGGAGRFWQPPVDIYEKDEAVVIKMEIAGARAEDLQVSLSPDSRVLTVHGARAEEPADRDGRLRCHQLEIYFGPFERLIPLPSGLSIDREHLTAVYRDGFLLVTLPKKPVAEKPQMRIIPISGEEAQPQRQTEPKTQVESEG